MEICEIRSRQLSFRSGTLSAEHVSLRFLDEDIDYVWQPRPGHWEHGSFLCFPLLGRLPEGGTAWTDGHMICRCMALPSMRSLP